MIPVHRTVQGIIYIYINLKLILVFLSFLKKQTKKLWLDDRRMAMLSYWISLFWVNSTFLRVLFLIACMAYPAISIQYLKETPGRYQPGKELVIYSHNDNSSTKIVKH